MTLNGGHVKAMRAHMDGQTGVYGRVYMERTLEGLGQHATCIVYGRTYIYIHMTRHVESIEDQQEGAGARFFRFKITGVGRDSLK